jgi:SpoVK/Ycf46/Vps4 family AAA+-type ATPase
VRKTEGYSGSDLTAVAKDAAMGPIRDLGTRISSVSERQIEPVSIRHFRDAIKAIRPSVSPESLRAYDEWTADHADIGR